MKGWNRNQLLALAGLLIAIIACIGAYLALEPISYALGFDRPPTSRCTDFGIRIISPINGAEVGETFQVSGTYTAKPPDNSLLTYVIAPNGEEFWPQYKVESNPTTRSWMGQCDLKGEPPKEAYCGVAVVGNSGRIMFDHYWKVGESALVWVPYDRLTDDTEICDRVFVQRNK